MMRIAKIALFSGLAFATGALAAQPNDSLGRLFFTPEQRARLDAGTPLTRPEPRRTTPPAAPATRRPAAPRGPAELRLGGVVTRSDGERTIWIDGMPYHNGSPGDVRVLLDASDPGAVRVQPQGTKAPIEVRVGQTLDRRSGAVREPFEPDNRTRGQP